MKLKVCDSPAKKMKKKTTNILKTVSLDTMIDKHIGKPGTEKREAFENELRIDLLGYAIMSVIK